MLGIRIARSKVRSGQTYGPTTLPIRARFGSFGVSKYS